MEEGLVCAAIRFAPVWLCFLAHCPQLSWPTAAQTYQRVNRYGFSVATFKRNPFVLVTHIFVHSSNQHLLGNVTGLLYILLQLRGSFLPESSREDNVWWSVRETICSFVVFMLGGVAGVGAEVLFLHALLRKRGCMMSPFSWVIERLCRWEELGSSFIAPRLIDLFDRLTYEMNKQRVDHCLSCGASNGVFSLFGFAAGNSGNFAIALMLGVEELGGILMDRLNNASPQFWKDLSSNVNVARIAHVSGLAMGVLCGVLWRRWQQSRQGATSHRCNVAGSDHATRMEKVRSAYRFTVAKVLQPSVCCLFLPQVLSGVRETAFRNFHFLP